MDLQLENKIALVTGSTAGIGLATAKGLAAEGATVVVNGRTEKRVQEAIEKLTAAKVKGKLIPLAADLGTVDGVQLAIKQLPRLNILVNNLGIYSPKPYNELTDEDWQHIFEVNVMSGVRLSRHYMPLMMQENWGRIVFISSESALQIPVEMIHYGMTKTAQLAIARGLAEATVGTAVTVNSILAGATLSEGVEAYINEVAKKTGATPAQVEKDFFANARPTQLLKRFTSPEEVAAMVTYVCSPLSSATNGAALRADGGTVKAIV